MKRLFINDALAPDGLVARGGGIAPASPRTIAEDPSQIAYRNATLLDLLMRAYSIKRYQIAGPAWLESERYDVVAKLRPGTARAQIPVMLQSLLVERFRITLRWETRQGPVYELTVAKNGPNLKESKDANGAPREEELIFAPSSTEFTGTTLSAFAARIGNILGSPVEDKTGVKGTFDIALGISMQDLMAIGRATMPADERVSDETTASAPASLSTALHEVGLKLERKKGPIRYLVIDKAEKVPTEN